MSDDLLADLVAGARGRRPAPLAMAMVRPLGADDLSLLASLEPGDLGTAPPTLARIRNTHHTMARLLAEGRKGAEVAAITGYSVSRISLLQKDPAFAELVDYYRTQADAVFSSAQERLAALGMTATEELQERLEENAAGFTNRELMDAASFAFDRSVAPTKGGLGRPNLGALGGGSQSGPQITINFVEPEPGKGGSPRVQITTSDAPPMLDITPE